MFILDSLLIGSLRFVLDKVVQAAEAEMHDDSALRDQLLEVKAKGNGNAAALGSRRGEGLSRIRAPR